MMGNAYKSNTVIKFDGAKFKEAVKRVAAERGTTMTAINIKLGRSDNYLTTCCHANRIPINALRLYCEHLGLDADDYILEHPERNANTEIALKPIRVTYHADIDGMDVFVSTASNGAQRIVDVGVIYDGKSQDHTFIFDTMEEK